MEYKTNYRPEGCLIRTAENQRYISSAEGLREAKEKGKILEARASVCTGDHDLIVELPCGKGIIPRELGAIGIKDGSVRDIALISRVNKPVCFKVISVDTTSDGKVTATLSRLAAQEEFAENQLSKMKIGDIIDTRITHLEQFGAFVDVGCGIPSMIPIDAISVSRISHPSDRFAAGQLIRAVLKDIDGTRLFLTHKELLGTWEENAGYFHPGETVSGVVRSVESYGIFVELAPNLAGLAELRDDIYPGQNVSVYIKALIPEKMKVKLVIVDTCDEYENNNAFRYFYEGDHISRWDYAPKCCGREISSIFE